jgi:hypothetical protein
MRIAPRSSSLIAPTVAPPAPAPTETPRSDAPAAGAGGGAASELTKPWAGFLANGAPTAKVDVVGPRGGAQLAAVRGGTALDGVDAAKIQQFNLKSVVLPKEIARIADATFGDRAVRIATAGYSAPPSGTQYAEHTARFLEALADHLGHGQVGFVTSPTADKGSIDALTTTVGQQLGVPVLNITAKGYVDYIDPAKFPAAIDQAAYAKAPKYVFPDAARYNQATALASNAFLATGGREVTVFDFMRAIEKGNPAVVVVDDTMKAAMGESAVWDAAKNRPNNGAAYLAEQLGSFLKDGSLPHPDVAKDGMGAFDAAWLQKHRPALEKLVQVVHIDSDDVSAAAAAAARHLPTALGD